MRWLHDSVAHNADDISTGSWAFLIGSVIQLYESVDKHPVETAEKKA